jgi:hypothetical protein
MKCRGETDHSKHSLYLRVVKRSRGELNLAGRLEILHVTCEGDDVLGALQKKLGHIVQSEPSAFTHTPIGQRLSNTAIFGHICFVILSSSFLFLFSICQHVLCSSLSYSPTVTCIDQVLVETTDQQLP